MMIADDPYRIPDQYIETSTSDVCDDGTIVIIIKTAKTIVEGGIPVEALAEEGKKEWASTDIQPLQPSKRSTGTEPIAGIGSGGDAGRQRPAQLGSTYG